MTSTILRPSHGASRGARCQLSEPNCPSRPSVADDHVRREHATGSQRAVLGHYTDLRGRPRELITRPGQHGSVLLVDRDTATLGDRRLVAHLGADEPAKNAGITAAVYLEHIGREDCRCRALMPQDFSASPFPENPADEPDAAGADEGGLFDRTGRRYRLERIDTGMSIPELRWRRSPCDGSDGESQTVSVRDAIAGLESYEPVRRLTSRALSAARDDGTVSTAVLRVELARMNESPIVLNRGLRAAVLAAAEKQGLSMSEIAIRCGRVKHDHAGNESGETSWLARRLGMLAEGGRDAPTPWVHSDVLALIARRGLGISPREAEVA